MWSLQLNQKLKLLGGVLLLLIGIGLFLYFYTSNKTQKWQWESNSSPNTPQPQNLDPQVVSEKFTKNLAEGRGFELEFPRTLQDNFSYDLPCIIDTVDFDRQVELSPQYYALGIISCYYLDNQKKQQTIDIPIALVHSENNSHWIIGSEPHPPGIEQINSNLTRGIMQDRGIQGSGNIIQIVFNFNNLQSVDFVSSRDFTFPIQEQLYSSETIESFAQTGNADLIPNKLLIPIDVGFNTSYNEL